MATAPYAQRSVPDLLSDPTRLACLLGGGLLTLLGARRGGMLGAGLVLAGGAVAFKGLADLPLAGEGGMLEEGLHRLERTLPTGAVKIARSITIGRPREEVWRFVRDLSGFSRWARHVESVITTDDGRSHWMVRAPGGTRIEWDAMIEAESPNERISWQTLPGSEIRHAGVITLRDAPGGRGTELILRLNYEAPGGVLGRTIARLMGEEPGIQARDDLRRLKQLLETGEMATNAMRPEDAGRERF
ncbi:SRPBCC family protein [Benzoatithermus flavus]|uniref:SRPBCC family protein n=1 Tax=Benzoatithermus flavus TaxID=3108223 RepID=A0ABU8XQF1_9PROT